MFITCTKKNHGSFIPDSTDLNATYIFSPVDTLAGNVSLILTSTNACLDISDTLNIEITPAPKVIAKIEQGICTNSDTVKLNSNIQVASGGFWITNGSGTFDPDSTVLSGYEVINYIIGQQEIDSGTVELTLTTTGNGACNAEEYTLTVPIIPAPVANAGTDGEWTFNTTSSVLNITHMRNNGTVVHWDYTAGDNNTSNHNTDAVGTMGVRENGVN